MYIKCPGVRYVRATLVGKPRRGFLKGEGWFIVGEQYGVSFKIEIWRFLSCVYIYIYFLEMILWDSRGELLDGKDYFMTRVMEKYKLVTLLKRNWTDRNFIFFDKVIIPWILHNWNWQPILKNISKKYKKELTLNNIILYFRTFKKNYSMARIILYTNREKKYKLVMLLKRNWTDRNFIFFDKVTIPWILFTIEIGNQVNSKKYF